MPESPPRDATAIDADFAVLFHRMAQAFEQAPPPSPVYVPEATLSAVSQAHAVGILYGWVNRVVRTGEAVLKLDHSGYGTEASPLVRSMLEHAIAAWWLIDMPGDAYQALVRGRQRQLTSLEEAEAQGWVIDAESKKRIREALEFETEKRSPGVDHLRSAKNQAERYGLGSLYQAWLIETWTSHASFESAQPYLHHTGNGKTTLLGIPKPHHARLSVTVTSTTHTALTVYNEVLPDSALRPVLSGVHAKFEELAADLAAASPTGSDRESPPPTLLE